MADIFLSYARADLERVRPLIQAFERLGWSVWWDFNIRAGSQFDRDIEKALKDVACVVVVWSKHSVDSDWVRAEASYGLDRRPLVSVSIDDNIDLPIRFTLVHTESLAHWDGTEQSASFLKVKAALESIIGAKALPLTFTNSIGMTFVRIPSGEFMMGSSDSDVEASDFEKPPHRIIISQPFYLGQYPVTQAQWQEVMGNHPSEFGGHPNHPVEQVSWDEVQAFIRELNQREGVTHYRLPTEAQWEYACRAGSATPRYRDNIDAIAWYVANSGYQTHPVGQKLPNDWGLYDMLGNVWEWCHDGNRTYSSASVIDPMGPRNASAARVFRGGFWGGDARFVRASYRYWRDPGDRVANIGFRCLSLGVSG
jgi:formylglycine-generating enzyme required for sulfatase activity